MWFARNKRSAKTAASEEPAVGSMTAAEQISDLLTRSAKFVNVNGRWYPVMPTADQLGRSIGARQPGALVTSWDKAEPQLKEVMLDAGSAGLGLLPAFEKYYESLGPRSESETIALVACTSCGEVLSGFTLGRHLASEPGRLSLRELRWCQLPSHHRFGRFRPARKRRIWTFAGDLSCGLKRTKANR